MAKHIFVTGGVVSSLGKGLTCASIGMLLEQRGLRVRLQKFDPYINVDPGTMSPYQHGEVYVLDDGAETDLDLGHYERFTRRPADPRLQLHDRQDLPLGDPEGARGASTTRGRPSRSSPTSPTRSRTAIHRLATDDVDVVITEIGGTVGDIEGLPFLEAIRQFALDVGRENCLYIHLTLVPYLKAAGELKTKPTQHSVGALRQIGIQPDVLICRTEHPISRRRQGQDRPVLQRRSQGGDRGARQAVQHLRGPAEPGQPRARRDPGQAAAAQGRARSTSATGATWSSGSSTPSTRCGSRSSAST